MRDGNQVMVFENQSPASYEDLIKANWGGMENRRKRFIAFFIALVLGVMIYNFEVKEIKIESDDGETIDLVVPYRIR